MLQSHRISNVRLALTLVLLLAVMIAISVFAGGCDSVRFAPSEAQKQISYDTYLTAQTVNAQGTEPKSEAAARLVTGTGTMLTYTGLPKDPVITDYKTTSEQAQQDAAGRPTIEDVSKAADGWLATAIGVAGLFSGGAALKAASWLQQLRDKAKALKDVVQGNEQFKQWLEVNGKVMESDAFRAAQINVQSAKTEQAVAVIRSELPSPVSTATITPTAASKTTVNQV